MDFERVLRALLELFEREKIRYGVLGGFALGALGVPRTTMDIDFLVHRDDLERLNRFLTEIGYERWVRTENVSHYRHTDPAWGGVDILHAFRQYSFEILERTRAQPVFGGTLHIKVLQPEDVIGFKIQAIANNPLRAAHEALDIESLMSHYRNKLDWKRIQEFYELFEHGEEGRRMRERFDHAE